jgi:hypothetical protein
MNASTYSGWRFVRQALGTVAVLVLAGCRLDDMLRSDRDSYLWLILPAAGFLLAGTALVYYRRKAQFAAWDLRRAAEEPSPRPILLTTIWAAAGLVVLFAAYNRFFLDLIAPRQQLLNVGLWTAGTLIGSAVSLLLGLRLAEPGGSRTLPSSEG